MDFQAPDKAGTRQTHHRKSQLPQRQTALHNNAKEALKEQTGQHTTPSATNLAIMPNGKASNENTDTKFEIIIKAFDTKKNGKSPAMPEPRKPKEPAKKRKPDKDYRPMSLPAKLRHQPPTTQSLHKRKEDILGCNTQANSELCDTSRNKQEMEATPLANRGEQALRPRTQQTYLTK